MDTKKVIIAGDGHFHLYPCWAPANAIGNLIHNLGRMAKSAGDFEPEQDVFKIAFLAESQRYDYFHNILRKEINFGAVGFETSAGPGEHCVAFTQNGRRALYLMAGRQIVTKEKLELLGLGMEEIVPDGLPAEEVIEKIIAADGLPTLAFSPGKWFFNRGRIARKLVKRYGRSIIIGDSALRPAGWPEPAIMHQAKTNNIAFLPGSDPLPLPGDDQYAGSYGFIYQGSFDPARPLASMKAIIAATPQAILPAGRRHSFLNVVGRLFRLQRNRE